MTRLRRIPRHNRSLQAPQDVIASYDARSPAFKRAVRLLLHTPSDYTHTLLVHVLQSTHKFKSKNLIAASKSHVGFQLRCSRNQTFREDML